MHQTHESPLSRALVLLMAITTGVAVASNYYAQPLLHTIAGKLGLSFADAGVIVTVAQAGYAAGLLFLVPLGDLLDRRRMIGVMMLLAAGGLFISASAVSLPMLLVGTALTGVFSVVAQVLVPFAATLARPEERGQVVGTVMSGLLLGILLARTVSGALSSLGTWRTVYWVAGVLMLINAVALYRALPSYKSETRMSYATLLASIGHLFRAHALLRRQALIGFLVFAMFSVFWTSMAFLLSSPPFQYSDAVIGLFGLAGAVGALAARQAGRLVDQGRGHQTTLAGAVMLLIAWGLLWWVPHELVWLVVAIVLLDLAVQAMHITNMNLIYAIDQAARSRLNAGYMTCYFLGGAFGSLASAWMYQHYAWNGVALLGGAIAVVTAVVGVASHVGRARA
ncbi:MFS transporter [Larsenimonas suaedae]|uniref:MFS transporter n=1 Tax=Larsenimonas suaedae TaxID=1851019 RepID=A0ABU1GSJ2_9GAMM|nr:MFS transporter [Larsenimonas suaedae]MCM2972226.1 MFS transporter [Larsenimonas suaedae]MDR5894978.1 MFS transporter [Larsenimonas suaedae]